MNDWFVGRIVEDALKSEMLKWVMEDPDLFGEFCRKVTAADCFGMLDSQLRLANKKEISAFLAVMEPYIRENDYPVVRVCKGLICGEFSDGDRTLGFYWPDGKLAVVNTDAKKNIGWKFVKVK